MFFCISSFLSSFALDSPQQSFAHSILVILSVISSKIPTFSSHYIFSYIFPVVAYKSGNAG